MKKLTYQQVEKHASKHLEDLRDMDTLNELGKALIATSRGLIDAINENIEEEKTIFYGDRTIAASKEMHDKLTKINASRILNETR